MAGRTGRATAWLLVSWSVFAAAEIYRYQDHDGLWHFTDDPPPGAEAEPVPGITWGASRPHAPEDLSARLGEDFNPVTPIARATMAVVIIQGGSTAGSGFFCSPDGHILTNRHIVQRSEDSLSESRGGTGSTEAGAVNALVEEIASARAALQHMEKDLQGYERVIEGATNDATRDWAVESHARLTKRYHSDQAKVDAMNQRLRAMGQTPSGSGDELEQTGENETPATMFDVMLQDGTVEQASLLEVSTHNDLALLKLEGIRTPYLRLDELHTLSQGQRVFAIGSPLGSQATVSSGLITRIDTDYVHTDVQIVPATSGTPLITEEGGVVGINVVEPATEGVPENPRVAKAIPTQAALRDFPQIPRPPRH